MLAVIRLIRPVVRVALVVALATLLVCLAILNIALVKALHGDTAAPVAWPLEPHGLFYSLALAGILAVVVGSSVRLRRPNDPATLHFFWLMVAFFGVLAFTPVGRFDRLDGWLDWANAIARFALPPIFLHFALVFPERAHAWVRTPAGRRAVPVLYLPAAVLGVWRIFAAGGGLRGAAVARIDVVNRVHVAVYLAGGLALMLRALARLRSVTAERQRRWIIWGSTLGAIPFAALYVIPLATGYVPPMAQYSGVLLGCIPLAFASALVRYRLMDVEVIVKKTLAVVAVVLLLGCIYIGTLEVIGLVAGADEATSRFWALFATLVVATVRPLVWRAIQSAVDRLYYRDRYDYRRALIVFARDLNSDLDLSRLSNRLVGRIHDTLAVDRLALYLAGPSDDAGDFTTVAAAGFGSTAPPPISRSSVLGARLVAGHAAVVDDPVLHRRIAAEDAGVWREAGLYQFVPCVSTNVTIAIIAVGRRAHGEPLSSEDMTLLGAVASQAATALENARLYGQLRMKADEIDQLRQFSDSVVESLSDGLVVVDLEDRVLRWNRQVEALTDIHREDAVGRPLQASFSREFVDVVIGARRQFPSGTTVYRVPLSTRPGDGHPPRTLNIGVSPFQTADGSQAGSIVVIEDVTERAHLEEQLQLSEKMAAIGMLAAGVAHEVNTPLAGISSFTQMLLDRAEPGDPKTQLLEKIERQTFRAAKIVSSLLNLARPSGGDAGAVDLNLVIADVLSLLEHQLRMSHIQVRKEFDAPSLVVQGVEYKLQQIFLNLFLNARDAMPKGGWLSVAGRIDGHDAVVEVGDTGVGIPAEHLARIYDPFFTTKAEGRGTGLGLSVTYGIVREHRGTLTCTSDVGQGTKFKLVLPLDHESNAAVAATSL